MTGYLSEYYEPCPSFFDFKVYRTKYRYENAVFELVEGIVLLGLH
jgi:hypothetical protein